jgi:peptidoglycan-associated lipoprotein
LEAVVDAYPESAAAATAREELGSLYNIRARNASTSGTTEPTARWIPAQNNSPEPANDSEVRRVGSTDNGDRSTLTKEALARARQTRRDERWLRALSFDFQMAAGDRVFFAESSIDIGARARDVLAAQARWLTRHPELPVFVEAHADDYTGNRDLEVQIAERRARAVQQRLVEEGVDAARITVVAFGRDRPVATCQAPECTAQNRRVITRVGHLPDLERGRHGIEKPALAIVPPRSAPTNRD